MFLARIGVWQFVATLALLIGLNSAAQAAGWLDDFNDGSATDGNPVTWVEDLGGSGLFPGVYSANTAAHPGDYFMDPADDNIFGFSVTFVNSPVFTDVYLRAQGKVLPDPIDPLNFAGNLALLGRIDPATLNSYVLYIDTGGGLQLQKSVAGEPEDFPDLTSGVALGFNAGSDVIIELNVVGNQLSGFAWLPGEEKPAVPQVTATDTDFLVPAYASGRAGLAYAEDDDFTSGVFRFAAAQDTPFIDPPTELLGDYNEDGTVNAADYAVWRDGGSPDDTQAGYDLWKANFGNTNEELGSGSAAVPEPASLVCVFLALAGAAGFYRSRNLR